MSKKGQNLTQHGEQTAANKIAFIGLELVDVSGRGMKPIALGKNKIIY